jgi:DNA-binding transcriptional MerR regulator
MSFAGNDWGVARAASGRNVELLRPEEIERIERDHARGVSARVIVDVFAERGVRLSEATFRKYVQAGLLPRSRRVGRKGKHRGSQGLYPVEAVRRINAIKKMMAAGLTLEDIKGSFVVLRNHIDLANRELGEVFAALEQILEGRADGGRRGSELSGQLRALKDRTHSLIDEVARLGSTVTAKAGVVSETL